MKDRPHDDAMADLFREDRGLAVEMLNSIFEDGDQGKLMIALRQMTKAFGGVPKVAAQAHLNPTQLYRTLSPEGNPAFSSLSTILKVMGLRLAVQPSRLRPHQHEPDKLRSTIFLAPPSTQGERLARSVDVVHARGWGAGR